VKTMCITRPDLCDESEFDGFLAALSSGPPDYFEVRVRGLSDRRLVGLLERAVACLSATAVLANARFDLALGAGAAGVVLPASGLPVEDVARETPRGFLVGRSVHSPEEAAAAIAAGADIVLLGPIFDSPEKRPFGPPLGLDVLDRLPEPAVGDAEIFLVGGIAPEKLPALSAHRHRVAGVAAIRAFDVDPSGASAALASW